MHMWVGGALLWALHALPPAQRVEAARTHESSLRALFAARGVSYPPEELYLRVFKHERELEVWAGLRGAPLRHIKTFPICAASGQLGPKRARGDLQVPEGFYVIDRFNPASSFHVSLRVSYPNASDRRLGARDPGGDIYIHGGCASIGCLAIEDGPIEELYLLALAARRRPIPVHIFPRKMDDEGWQALAREGDEARRRFWRQLQPGFLLFEATRRPPRVSVDPANGNYRVEPGA